MSIVRECTVIVMQVHGSRETKAKYAIRGLFLVHANVGSKKGYTNLKGTNPHAFGCVYRRRKSNLTICNAWGATECKTTT